MSSFSPGTESGVSLRQEEYDLWMRYANADYDLVQHLYFGDYYPKPLEIICYHCQQAAEKAVKAVIAYFGNQGGMPKLHDIQFLLMQIRNLVKAKTGADIDETLLDQAAELTKYGVAPRYPNAMEIGDPETRRAVQNAGSILEWARSVVRETDEGPASPANHSG